MTDSCNKDYITEYIINYIFSYIVFGWATYVCSDDILGGTCYASGPLDAWQSLPLALTTL